MHNMDHLFCINVMLAKCTHNHTNCYICFLKNASWCGEANTMGQSVVYSHILGADTWLMQKKLILTYDGLKMTYMPLWLLPCKARSFLGNE